MRWPGRTMRATLDVEVKQISGMLVLIAHDGRRRIERAQTIESQAAQDAADGGPAQSQLPRDAPAVPTQAAQPLHLRDHGHVRLPGRTMRTRGAIPKIGHSVGPVAAHPLGGRLGAHVEAGRGQLQRASLIKNFSGQLLSLMDHKSGILVIVHSFLRSSLLLNTISFSDPVRMDNLLIIYRDARIHEPWKCSRIRVRSSIL